MFVYRLLNIDPFRERSRIGWVVTLVVVDSSHSETSSAVFLVTTARYYERLLSSESGRSRVIAMQRSERMQKEGRPADEQERKQR